MVTVNITPTASSKGLREELEREALRRGLNFRQLVGDIYTFATKNRGKFRAPLEGPRDRVGAHIGAVVDDQVGAALKEWAKERKTSRGDLCRYILEMTLEEKLLRQVFPDEN